MQFTDQVEILANWFKDWNECEQTVALYSLLKRVKKCQAKFLSRCLEYFLSDSGELIRLENEANTPEYVSHLLYVSKTSDVIQVLLSHLPLLKPGNEAAKDSYLKVLPKVLSFAVTQSEFLEESRQLLSYSLIHPAFDNKERSMLTAWMSGLNGSQKAVSKQAVNSPGELSPKNSSATNSLEPGVSLSDWNPRETEDFQTNRIKDYSNHTPSTASVCAPPPPLERQPYHVPSHSAADFPPADGMADVPSWLKSLRLHKYADLFTPMTYNEMMNLSEHDLDNVTKGARNKIILNINKLHKRFAQLQSLENEILGGGSLSKSLLELKTILQTPIKRYDSGSRPFPPTTGIGGPGRREVIEEGDIPSLFTKVMGKACTQLLVSKPDEENITSYMKLLDRCLNHQAFTDLHKRRLSSWKQQVNKMYRSLPRHTRPPQSSRSQPNVGYLGLQRLPRNHFVCQPRAPTPRPLHSLSPPMRPVGLFPPQNHLNWYSNSSNLTPLAHPSPVEVTRKTASLDPRLGHSMYHDPDDESPRSEINDQLVSLCQSVAESALSDGFDGSSTL